jgi:hypothetical protein
MNGVFNLSVNNKTWSNVITGRWRKIYIPATDYFRKRIQKQIPHTLTLRLNFSPSTISYKVSGVTTEMGKAELGLDPSIQYYVIHVKNEKRI